MKALNRKYLLIMLISCLFALQLGNVLTARSDFYPDREYSLESHISQDNTEFVKIAISNQGQFTKGHNSFSRKNIQNSGLFLLLSIQTGIFVLIGTRILRETQKATTHSQKSIIAYIHNKDGQKK